MQPVEKLAWDSLLDADMNARYWGELARRYRNREMYIKIFLAVTSSATVASWALWMAFPLSWQVLSALSAVLAIVLPILNMPERVQLAADLRGNWSQLLVEYEKLWAKIQAGSARRVETSYDSLKAREIEMSKVETKLPRDVRLIRKCQADVLRSRGLPQDAKEGKRNERRST